MLDCAAFVVPTSARQLQLSWAGTTLMSTWSKKQPVQWDVSSIVLASSSSTHSTHPQWPPLRLSLSARLAVTRVQAMKQVLPACCLKHPVCCRRHQRRLRLPKSATTSKCVAGWIGLATRIATIKITNVLVPGMEVTAAPRKGISPQVSCIVSTVCVWIHFTATSAASNASHSL